MGNSERRGLGRGLEEIIRESSRGEQPLLPGDTTLLTPLVDAGLSLLDELGELSHLAYLHLPNDGEPQLFQRRPRLDAVEPTMLYRFYRLIDAATADGEPFGQANFNGTDLRFVRSKGWRSAGVHIFGTAGKPFSPERLTGLQDVASLAATALHQYNEGPPAPETVPRITVEYGSGGVTATASGHESTGNMRTGSATSASADCATASAVIDAHDKQFHVADVRVVPLDGQLAAVVTLADNEASLRLGLVVGGLSREELVAAATVRALS